MDPINDFLIHFRNDYHADILDLSRVGEDPVELFEGWMKTAIEAGEPEPNAMVLATVGSDHRVSSRVVLLRGIDATGLSFFTNYQSHKGRDLETNPQAALNFFWPAIHRQVRIEGLVEKLPEKESDAYFDSRPRESQLGAWASAQSQPLANRQELEEKLASLTTRFEGKPVPRPPHWGGFRLNPDYFEFWLGRTSRLHDRLAYQRISGHWTSTRLNP